MDETTYVPDQPPAPEVQPQPEPHAPSAPEAPPADLDGDDGAEGRSEPNPEYAAKRYVRQRDAEREHARLLQEQIQDALGKGASLQTGGHPLEGPGNFFTPAVLTGVDHTMDIMREESFGPVIGIMKVKDDEEAIRLMNDTDYGLTASV